ncbi:aquaglyceroporin related protein [Microdochium nivale]|nr:aquaglyceroporin related protein [Microdochium nivale]
MVSPIQKVRERLGPQQRQQQLDDSPLPLYQQRRGANMNSRSTSSTGELPDTSAPPQHHEHPTPRLDQPRKALGLGAEPPSSALRRAKNTHMRWNRARLILREPILEFWGVLIFVMFGDSVIAQWKLSGGEFGNWVTVCFGWGFGIMFGIFVAGDSGAYLNPAVTLTNCIFRGIPLKRFPIYTTAQVLGAFCAHAITYAVYHSAINEYEGGAGVRTVPPVETASAGIFCSFPAGENVPKGSQVMGDFVANFILVFCIFALRDENGADLKGGGGNFVLAIGWLTFTLFACFGWLTGSPINPGRDISGRIWITIMGYDGAWSTMGSWAWVPCVVPFLGCFSGGVFYDFFIYTGESPINTDGWGLPGIWYLLSCGRSRRLPGHSHDDDNNEESVRKGTGSNEDVVSAMEHGFGSVASLQARHDHEAQATEGNSHQNSNNALSQQITGDKSTHYDDSRGNETQDLDYKQEKEKPYDYSPDNDSTPRIGTRSQISGSSNYNNDDTSPKALGARSLSSAATASGLSRHQHNHRRSDYFGKMLSQQQRQQQQQQQPRQSPGPAALVQQRHKSVQGPIGSWSGHSEATTPSTPAQPGERRGPGASTQRIGSSSHTTPRPQPSASDARPWQWASRWTDEELGRKIAKDSYSG